MVVHREREQHGEQEDRNPSLDAFYLLKAEQVGREPVLEDHDEQAVGGADREQVQNDGGGGEDQGPEDQGEEQEAQPEDEGKHDRQPVVDDVGVVDVLRGGPANEHTGAGSVERGRDQVGAESVKTPACLGVVGVADQRDADERHLAVLGDLLL